MAKVFAVVVNWNQKEATEKCVKSLLKNAPKISVVIIDNGSTDNSFSYLQENLAVPEKIFLIKSKENLGFAGGVNLGVKFALKKNASFVLILNNDVIFGPDFLKPLIKEFKKDDKLGVISPVIYYFPQKNKIWYAGGEIDFLQLKVRHLNFIKKETTYKTGFASGCVMLVKKQVFQKVGFLKEKYFMFFEDADFSVRVKKTNFKIKVAPSSKVYHAESTSIRESPLKAYYLVRNGLIFGKENYSICALSWLYIFFFLRLFYNFIKRLFRPQNEALKAVFEGLIDFIKGKEGKKQ